MELRLKRLALFSSGVGFFEHEGSAEGPETVNLVFDAGAVNDALKSLVVRDAASGFPSVSYASASALNETLGSLKVDLSGEADLQSILNSLKGAEIDVSAPAKISGRIVGVEKRTAGARGGGEADEELYLLLFTGAEVRAVAVRDIAAFSFRDDQITADLNRALDILAAARDDKNRSLAVSLPGEGSRKVALSYVIPSALWKVSYRLDLAARTPFIQGWAIVDNDSDTDWNGVELSLVTGKPVSFIQNLSVPYVTQRPELPLAIAGVAKARTYESGEAENGEEEETVADINQSFAAAADEDEEEYSGPQFASFSRRRSTRGEDRVQDLELDDSETTVPPVLEIVRAKPAGEQFEFTLKDSVTIERRKSAMLPLIEAEMKAEKLLVLSGEDALSRTVNPSLSVELTNTTGMKLPAGPITVYDGGTYAGDALIKFLPENEKRIISYGEDLSVRGSASYSGARTFMAVSLAKGALTVTRTLTHKYTYTVRNASAAPKKLIIEHPITRGASLVTPARCEEKTPDLYRFAVDLPANREIEFTVTEEEPLSEKIAVGHISSDSLIGYSADKRIPADIRATLKKAAALSKKMSEAENLIDELTKKKDGIASEQERIRKNLEAVGNQDAQGRRYVSRLAAMDEEIDALNKSIHEAAEKAGAAKKEFEDSIGSPPPLREL